MIGVGSFGQHHARIYAQHSKATLVGVVDQIPERAREIALLYGCEQFLDLSTLLASVDAVSIATPAIYHAEITKQCFERGVHVLVEKPIAATVDEAKHCIDIAEKQNLIYQIGHLERFNGGLIDVPNMITTPMFIDSYRLSKFSDRNTDVDVVLDLMIHDLDILLWLIKCDIIEVQAVGASVWSSSLDLANARIIFCNGCVANLSVSRVSDAKVRTMTIAQPDSVLLVNYELGTVGIFSGLQRTQTDKTHPVHEMIKHEGEPLCREIDSFLTCIQQNRPPLVSGREGLAALQLAHRVITTIQSYSPQSIRTLSEPHKVETDNHR